MYTLPLNVKQFAGADTSAYEKFQDYFAHYMFEKKRNPKFQTFSTERTFAEKEAQMNAVLLSEVERISGQKKPENMSLEQFSQNPLYKWAVTSVVATMIDAVIPYAIEQSIGVYTDIKYVGMGEVAQFDINPNSLYAVSKGSNARRSTAKTMEHQSSVTLAPVNHTITTSVALYEVMAGKKSLAELALKAIMSIEAQASRDAYDAINALADDASFPAELKETGYGQEELLSLCAKVEANNNGNAVIVGTKVALSKVVAAVDRGQRVDATNGIALIPDFYGYPMLELQQIHNGGSGYGVHLKDDRIYIMSTDKDKLVKGAIEGAVYGVSHDASTGSADASMGQTFNKRWDFQAVSNTVMGYLKFS